MELHPPRSRQAPLRRLRPHAPPRQLRRRKTRPSSPHHFDNLKSFDALANLFPAGFTHLSNTYEVKHASSYFDHLQELIHTTQKQSKVLVFLDPATGIENPGKPKNEHLRKMDIRRVCAQLREGEKLVLYQHASFMKDWQRMRQEQLKPLAEETGTTLGDHFYDRKTASDVCFFTFTKVAEDQTSIRKLRGEIQWQGDLDHSRRN